MNIEPAKQTRKFSISPSAIFLALGLLIGALYCIAIPFGAGFDEEQHIVRVYDISGGALIPNNENFVTLQDFFDYSYQRRLTQSPAFDMFTRESLSQALNTDQSHLRYNFRMRSFYPPVVYLPQAVSARILWRTFHFPILPAVMLERFAGLLMYLAGAYLAIRLLPFGKWMMAVLALSPMAIYQASTLNADGYTNAVSFLFIALVLHIYADREAKISPRWTLALVGVAFLLGLSKPGTVILLPLLLILSRNRFSSRTWWWVLLAGAFLAFLLNFGWTAFVLPNATFGEGQKSAIGGGLSSLLANPVDFLRLYFQGGLLAIPLYAKDWIAAYGYWAGAVPGPVYWFYLLLLAAALLSEPRVEYLSTKTRLYMGGVFLASCAAILAMFLMTEYVVNDVSPLGRQGRYFIPFAPLFFLALAGLSPFRENWQKVWKWTMAVSFAVVIGFYSFGMYTTYYTYCGYLSYAGDECILPIYKNLDKSRAVALPVTPDTPVRQSFVSHCNDLNAVQIYIGSVKKGAGGLRFSLLDDNLQVIVSRDLRYSEIAADEYLNLPLGAWLGQKDATYQLLIESLPSSKGEAVLAIGRGFFYDGTLFVAGQSKPGSLIIHYVCALP